MILEQASVQVETREAALCLIRRGDAFLVAEIQDPRTNLVLHRPPGGGIEEDEMPEQALRRELREDSALHSRQFWRSEPSTTYGFCADAKFASALGCFR